MYELNMTFTALDRSQLEAEFAAGREFYAGAGATDLLLGEFVNGANAGTFVWSLRFATLDHAIATIRSSIAMANDNTHEFAANRSRHQPLNRALNSVACEAGERAGPCLVVTPLKTTNMIPDAENQYAVDSMVANGAKGASVVIAVDGESIGLHYLAVYGDTFQQCNDATQANIRDKRVAAAIVDAGVTPINRLFIDIT